MLRRGSGKVHLRIIARAEIRKRKHSGRSAFAEQGRCVLGSGLSPAPRQRPVSAESDCPIAHNSLTKSHDYGDRIGSLEEAIASLAELLNDTRENLGH